LHPKPPLMESDEAHHIPLRGHWLLVVGRRHPPLWLAPARPWSQKTIANQLLQLPLHHRRTDPRIRGKDLALSYHRCREQRAAATREEMIAAVKNG
jgi:hypothetical protein